MQFVLDILAERVPPFVEVSRWAIEIDPFKAPPVMSQQKVKHTDPLSGTRDSTETISERGVWQMLKVTWLCFEAVAGM
jgi:hypothetical protein